MKHHDALLFSWQCENKWLELADNLLRNHGTLPVSVFCAELALLCDISVLTSRRYLEKHSAMSGSLVVAQGSVRRKADDEGF